MYTIDSHYYVKEFPNIDELIDDVLLSGMDPNYEIIYNGKHTGEFLIDLIQK
jgi:hypothetical protein